MATVIPIDPKSTPRHTDPPQSKPTYEMTTAELLEEYLGSFECNPVHGAIQAIADDLDTLIAAMDSGSMSCGVEPVNLIRRAEQRLRVLDRLLWNHLKAEKAVAP